MRLFASLHPETRRSLTERDPKAFVKLILRTVAFFSAFLGWILFAAATSVTNKNFYDDGGDWTDAIGLAPTLLAFLYNPLIIFLLLSYRRGRPIHPGIYVGVDLIIWALAVAAIVLSAGDGAYLDWVPTLYDDNGDPLCYPLGVDDGFIYPSKPCLPVIYTIGGIEIAANVFLFLVFVLHFTLFLFACIDTRRYKREQKIARTERRNIELQYNRSPEDHVANEPPAPPAYTEPVQREGVVDNSGVKYS